MAKKQRGLPGKAWHVLSKKKTNQNLGLHRPWSDGDRPSEGFPAAVMSRLID